MENLQKKQKVVVVSGISGMDGSWMVDYLLKNTDCLIYGGVRRLSVKNHINIEHVKDPRFQLLDFDLTDNNCISKVIRDLQPDYFINFAAQSFVGSSWDFPKQTFETNATAVLDILESIRLYAKHCRFYNAGTSEEFGDVIFTPQNESHPLRPRSPYGASKASARHLVKVYRESYDLYAIQGWLFNHEGIRRGEEFVTRKITKGVARIYNTLQKNEMQEIEPIKLGNLEILRDWSDAEDFVDGVWRMLNQDIYRSDLLTNLNSKLSNYIKEYILSSNETHSIREFVQLAFETAGIKGEWVGIGMDEMFVINNLLTTGKLIKLVVIDKNFYRPAEVETLQGDSSLARKELNWAPKTSFKDLVRKMVQNDIAVYTKR